MNKRTRTSRETSNTSNSNSDTDQPHLSEASNIKEEEIGIRTCKKRIRVDIINEEVKGWISSSKLQESPSEPVNTKEDIRLEDMKQKAEKAALK